MKQVNIRAGVHLEIQIGRKIEKNLLFNGVFVIFSAFKVGRQN